MRKTYWTLRFWEKDKLFVVYSTKKEALKKWLSAQLVRITITQLKGEVR